LAHVAELVGTSGLEVPTLNVHPDPSTLVKSPSILEVGLPVIFDGQAPPLVEIIHKMIANISNQHE